MAYSQNNYPQKQGITAPPGKTNYSIAAVGCFITAFCNLELDFNIQVDPLTLNNFFRDNNVYIDIDDGVKDDVDWGFIQRYDTSTRVTQIGGAGWPPSNQSIVKFAYTSPKTNTKMTHFCKVADTSNQQILDSFDGTVKHISATWYGQPVAWATYEHTAPQAVVATQPTPTYTVIDTTTKQIKLNKQPTNLWGMNYADPGALPPVEVHNAGEVWTVTNRVKHRNGYEYYRRLDQVDGFNVLDCDDYVEPVYQPPAAPVAVPISKDPYMLVVDVPFYSNAGDAKNKVNSKGMLGKETTYYVYNKQGDAYSLTTTNQTEGIWVNITENAIPVKKPTENNVNWVGARDDTAIPVVVIPPKPVPPKPPVVPIEPTQPVFTDPSLVPIADSTDTKWKGSYSSFTNDRTSIPYRMLQNVTMKEYAGKRKAVQLSAGQTINIVGTFEKNGIKFLRPRANNDEFFSWYYGVPQTDQDGNANLVKLVDDMRQLTLKDYVHYWRDDLKNIMDVFILRKKK